MPFSDNELKSQHTKTHFMSGLFGLGQTRKTKTNYVQLKDEQISKRYTDRNLNINLNALVHLQLASKILEYLIKRRVINYGGNTDKTHIAQKIIKDNMAFLEELTQKHEKGDIVDFDSYVVNAQERVQETVAKLVAILMTSERRLGGEQSELAAPVSYPVKMIIAVTIDDLTRLFEQNNPIEAKCQEYIGKPIDSKFKDSMEDFIVYLKDAIQKGNGTKSHKFLRIASTAVISLCRSVDGMALVRNKVDQSVSLSESEGTGKKIALDFSDLPDFEEIYENFNALFRDEELRLDIEGGSFCILAAATLQFIAKNFHHFPELETRMEELFADDSAFAGMSPAERDLAKGKGSIKGMKNLVTELEKLTVGWIDSSEALNIEERIQKIRPYLDKIVALLEAFCKSRELQVKGKLISDMGQIYRVEESDIAASQLKILDPPTESPKNTKDDKKIVANKDGKLTLDQKKQVFTFCMQLACMLRDLNKDGYVLVSDVEIPPSLNRVPMFSNFMNILEATRSQIRRHLKNKSRYDAAIDGDKSGQQVIELAQKLCLYLNNASLHLVEKK